MKFIFLEVTAYLTRQLLSRVFAQLHRLIAISEREFHFKEFKTTLLSNKTYSSIYFTLGTKDELFFQ